VKPLIDETKLQCLDRVPEDELRAEFVTQTIGLRKKIMNSVREVRLNNSPPLKGA
jgi:hypothetical protein